jgi:hypothetical protein
VTTLPSEKARRPGSFSASYSVLYVGSSFCSVLAGAPGCNLFVFHIPNDATNRDLFNIFAPYGNVISARIMVDRDTGRSRGFGACPLGIFPCASCPAFELRSHACIAQPVVVALQAL